VPRPYGRYVTEYIENCDLYAASSYAVTISNGSRVLKKLPVKARIDAETGRVELYVDPAKLEVLR
jgi:hypothetical protein